MSHLQTLMRYKAWANHQFLECVSGLPEVELVAARPIVFGSLIRTLNHVYLMDLVWQCHLLGISHGLQTRNPEEHPSIAELSERQREMDGWYSEYADAISGQEINEPVSFEYVEGGSGAMTRAEILLHVVNHGTYHRGHTADMLYAIGVSPPTTDLPVFLAQDQ